MIGTVPARAAKAATADRASRPPPSPGYTPRVVEVAVAQRPQPQPPLRRAKPPLADEIGSVLGRRGMPLQAKLAVGRVDDPLEHEADRVAERVMAAPAPSVQRSCACGGAAGPDGECAECKARRLSLQRAAAGPATAEAPPVVDRVLRSPGRPLDSSTRSFMEPRFGADFGDVRVHTDAEAAASADAVGALAYTVGSDVVFAAGQYAPSSPAGGRLLAHELTHVGQQRDAPRRLQRQCVEMPACPGLAVPIDALFPRWEAAEKCLQTSYRRSHSGNTIGFNKEWQDLIGRDAAEQEDLACFRGAFVARSGTHPAEPDIFDFTATTIHEITTPSGAPSRAARLAAEVRLADQLARESSNGCSGRIWSDGWWTPSPCYWLGGDLYFRAWNAGGVIVYQMVRDTTKEVLLATLLAALASTLKKGGGAAGKRLVPAYAIATLIAMSVTLASGRAEARVGPGDEEPIVTMFRALEAQGTPVPPELQAQMRAYLEANPALKQKMDAAMARGGSPTAAQEEINRQILQILRENPEAFTEEDLAALTMAAETVPSGTPGAPQTAEELRRALNDARAGRRGGSGGQGSGTGGGGTGSGSGTGSASGGPHASLSADSQARLQAASAGTRRLFEAMTGRTGGGPAVSDATVQRFLAIVEPAGLTPPEIDEVIARLGPIGATTPDEALTRLEGTLRQLSAGRAASTAAVAGAGQARQADVSGLRPGEMTFPLPEQLSVGAELDVQSVGRTMTGKAAFATGRIRIISFTETSVRVLFLEAADMYDVDGALVLPRSKLVGNTVTAARVGRRSGATQGGGGSR